MTTRGGHWHPRQNDGSVGPERPAVRARRRPSSIAGSLAPPNLKGARSVAGSLRPVGGDRQISGAASVHRPLSSTSITPRFRRLDLIGLDDELRNAEIRVAFRIDRGRGGWLEDITDELREAASSWWRLRAPVAYEDVRAALARIVDTYRPHTPFMAAVYDASVGEMVTAMMDENTAGLRSHIRRAAGARIVWNTLYRPQAVTPGGR
jgi:hypothetical protein